MPLARLSADQITYLLMLLRNSSQPKTTAELVQALQERDAR